MPARLQPGKVAVISGASGAAPATAEERAFLAEHQDIAVRATGTYLGHAFEPQFPMNVALAAIAVSRGNLYPPADDSGVERAMEGPLTQVGGHLRSATGAAKAWRWSKPSPEGERHAVQS